MPELPTGIAIHQWPRDAECRKIINAPVGMTLVEFDASQQEMRLMADYSNDSEMINGFLNGYDMHSFTAAESVTHTGYAKFQAEYTTLAHDTAEWKSLKKLRNLGKFCNLAMQYRAGVTSLQVQALTSYDLTIPEDEIKRLKNAYLRKYRGVNWWWNEAPRLAKAAGYAETRGGRKLHLAGWGGPFDYSEGSSAINFPIQGTGSDMKLYALTALKSWLIHYKITFAWDMHDGIFFYIPTSEAASIAAGMLQVLNKLDYGVWGWEPRVPLPWDCEIGPRWGDMVRL